ncbi:hypothetical protein V1294_006770 [Bradyrhizobium sp. AZCC 1678]|uniref:tripartite tricarboxylate transporter permease n=1 Tax=Bradyrhizobium sp. AZCC 1678 TaxID=3117030 RepID=UPI002FEFF61F
MPKEPEAALAVRPSPRVSHVKVSGEILGRPFLLLWSAIVGIPIGVLPAIGDSAANMLAYDQAKKFSRHPERFGTGVPDGIRQRQRRRLARDHHGIRHPGRRRDRRLACSAMRLSRPDSRWQR